MRMAGLLFIIFIISSAFVFAKDPPQHIVIGSKKFTENIILGDIAAYLSRDLGFATTHRRELGGTRVLWNALIAGDIDVYPEYSGTIRMEILQSLQLENDSQLDSALQLFDISQSPGLGFNNTYAIGIKRDLAKKLRMNTISDLRQHPDLAIGFTNEFMDRKDGWPGLQRRYQLPHKNVRGLDHDLAYRGIENGSIQILDMYSTDADIVYYDLVQLKDDLEYFPAYEAVYLFRNDLAERAPELVKMLEDMAGNLSEAKMINLNAQVKIEGRSEKAVAADFINEHFSADVAITNENVWGRFAHNTKAHLHLVGISLLAAIVVALPLGILAAKNVQIGSIVLGVVGVIQTIPSLALLVFMIPLLGIGAPPAIVALFLYSLLPIVRNTYTGIHDISGPIRESALALGLPAKMRLLQVELPLASRSILAGIKTSAVINVGTATLGALIGAGGYGQPILTGIRLDNVGLILEGAVPAALLALLVQWLFDMSELLLVPKGLRLQRKSLKR